MAETPPVFLRRREPGRHVDLPRPLRHGHDKIAGGSDLWSLRLRGGHQSPKPGLDGGLEIVAGHAQFADQGLQQLFDLEQRFAGVHQAVAASRTRKTLYILIEQGDGIDVPYAPTDAMPALAHRLQATRQMLQKCLTKLGILL